jgi:all-trans-8'-apo-beta-carotenal 15,15'-oxygenase
MDRFIDTAGGMNRRSMLSRLSLLTAAGLVDGAVAAPVLADEGDLGYLAVQAPSAEGAWTDLKVEGTIPAELNGSLYRVAPGQKTTFGVTLRHFFDGDAFVTKYQLRDGKASVRSRFIATPERQTEIAESRMLYNEFGTLAPAPGRGAKNQPSINVIRWDGRLLALSEGGHPSARDPETLAFQGYWDFHGTLPPDVSFTAHPKIDPVSGAGYGFGTHQGHDLALTVYRMELDGTLTRIAAIPQTNYFMIHDMLLGRDHIAFVVPPVHFDLASLFSRRVAAADAMRYMADEPTRVIVLRKDGTGEPIVLEQPACMVFHHGNLSESEDMITTDSLLSPDDSILRYIAAWSTHRAVKPQPNHLTRLSIDVRQRRIVDRQVLGEAQEFPRFDARMSGRAVRYLHTLGNEDNFAMRSLFRHDFVAGRTTRVDAEPGHAFGEAVFVPRPGQMVEGDGWLLHQGYSAPRNETYLDIRDAATLERIARVWTGQHFPLGLHGNFYFDS